MRNLISYAIALLFGFQLSAQSVNDSLSEKSYEQLAELTKTQLLLDFEIASKIAVYHIQKAKKENNLKEEFNGLDDFIEVAIWSRNFDGFQTEYDRLFQIAETNQFEKELMRSYYRQANAYFYQGVWSKSTETYYKSLEIAKELNHVIYQHTILTRLGYLKTTAGDTKSALKFQQDALSLLENAPDDTPDLTPKMKRQLKLQSLYYLSNSYLKSENIDSVRVYNSRGIELIENTQDSCMRRAFYRQRSELEILDHQYEAALSDLNLSKKYCLPLSKTDSLVLSGIYGKAYLGLKQYEKAVEALQKGADDYNVQASEEGFMDVHYKLLAKAYKHNGDIEKSNYYFEKYIHTTDEFNKIQDTVVTAFKQKEVNAFKKELKAIEYEKNRQKNFVMYIALGATLIILVLLLLLLKFYNNKKKNELKFQELLKKVNAAKENVITKVVDTKDEILEESSASDVSDEVTQQILDGLEKLESQDYFLKQDCNAYNVAKKIKTNTTYLSKVVNSHFQKNFNTYINDLRINYAIVRLENDTRFRSFSIQSIAEELGYKSADSFTKYFKQNTGLNPSFYIKQLNQLD
ncbi:MAG: helix-turn-helix domain-containing protein [Aquaticitalea sp.]